jgi:ubiquitin-like protein Pup
VEVVMAERIRKRKGSTSEAREDAPRGSAALAERGATLKKTIDDVVADIDDLLEENAEEFVKEYVQRGGE